MLRWSSTNLKEQKEQKRVSDYFLHISLSYRYSKCVLDYHSLVQFSKKLHKFIPSHNHKKIFSEFFDLQYRTLGKGLSRFWSVLIKLIIPVPVRYRTIIHKAMIFFFWVTNLHQYWFSNQYLRNLCSMLNLSNKIWFVYHTVPYLVESL